MSRNTLGEMNELVLLAMLHLADDANSARIAELLHQRTGRTIAPGRVYLTLVRLEDRGLVTSIRDIARAGAGGGRSFRIRREAALPLLRRSRRLRLGLWRGVESELDDRPGP